MAFDEKNFTVLGTLRPETRLLRRAHNTELPTSATPARAPTASELPPGIEILDSIRNPAAPIDDSTTTTAAAVASTVDKTGMPYFFNCVPPSTTSTLLTTCSQGEVYAVESNPSHIRIPHKYDEAVIDPIYGKKWRGACLDNFTGKYTDLGSWEDEGPPARAQGHQGQVRLLGQAQA